MKTTSSTHSPRPSARTSVWISPPCRLLGARRHRATRPCPGYHLRLCQRRLPGTLQECCRPEALGRERRVGIVASRRFRPPTLPSFSSIGAAINTIHRLAEFFASEDIPMATQPAVDSQMQVDDVDLLSSAFDRLRSLVLGSAWAEQIQWEPAQACPTAHRPALARRARGSGPTSNPSGPAQAELEEKRPGGPAHPTASGSGPGPTCKGEAGRTVPEDGCPVPPQGRGSQAQGSARLRRHCPQSFQEALQCGDWCHSGPGPP
jgi:hypothetical protein